MSDRDVTTGADPAAAWTDDGKPALDSGEPVLQRWLVLILLVLVPVGLGFAVYAFLNIEVEPIPVAERRPPGTEQITHLRGTAVLNEDRTVQVGPDCASEIEIVGDDGARTAAARALAQACTLMNEVEFGAAAEGLARWEEHDGLLRFAIFELSGVDASTRVEDGRVIIELNPKFQFRDGAEAAPFVLHELAHLIDGFPGEAVSAEDERDAMFIQLQACEAIRYSQEPPRGCSDAKELIELDDTTGALVDAGYRRETS